MALIVNLNDLYVKKEKKSFISTIKKIVFIDQFHITKNYTYSGFNMNT